MSRYDTYLKYVMECGTKEGFKVYSEPLRIPSTKNVSQIGMPPIRTK